MAAAKTHYEILELTTEAKSIDIKKAYRRLALQHHPDRNGGSAESTERFKLISEAYTILSNPNSRRSYDNELKCPTSASAVSSPLSSTSRTFSRDPFKQFDDLFTHDPFFHGAFEGMDDAFAARFNSSQVDKQEEGDGCAFWRCGDIDPKEKKQSLGEWIMNKLGIELTVTSYSKEADGSMTKSSYTSNAATGSTNKQSRTYVDEQGRKVTVMSIRKDGNVLEDKFIAGKLVERKVNGVLEPLPPEVTNNNRDDNIVHTASAFSNDRIPWS
ncbi:hypothetical protein ACHAXM_010570 [Skeletonema potamos]|jgi:curved DNA-binding protein CbpA